MALRRAIALNPLRGQASRQSEEFAMPTYSVTTSQGRLSAQQKSVIAKDITRIHSGATGAPPFFAQVLFHELAPGNAFIGGVAVDEQIFVCGQIRGGRTTGQKTKMIQEMLAATAVAAGTPQFNVWVYIVELVPGQMIEFGRILPVPGHEEEWLNSLSAEDRKRLKSFGL
jgi:phenylpyruvate tautomerase PptA (4-oxalocrotonate tautomerase family)